MTSSFFRLEIDFSNVFLSSLNIPTRFSFFSPHTYLGIIKQIESNRLVC